MFANRLQPSHPRVIVSGSAAEFAKSRPMPSVAWLSGSRCRRAVGRSSQMVRQQSRNAIHNGRASEIEIAAAVSVTSRLRELAGASYCWNRLGLILIRASFRERFAVAIRSGIRSGDEECRLLFGGFARLTNFLLPPLKLQT